MGAEEPTGKGAAAGESEALGAPLNLAAEEEAPSLGELQRELQLGLSLVNERVGKVDVRVGGIEEAITAIRDMLVQATGGPKSQMTPPSEVVEITPPTKAILSQA